MWTPWPQKLLQMKHIIGVGCLQIEKSSPLSSWRGTWHHADRCGARAENAGSRKLAVTLREAWEKGDLKSHPTVTHFLHQSHTSNSVTPFGGHFKPPQTLWHSKGKVKPGRNLSGVRMMPPPALLTSLVTVTKCLIKSYSREDLFGLSYFKSGYSPSWWEGTKAGLWGC